jgi:peptidoglycan/LPS O-acetylase OafA/YrhL
VTIGRKLTAAKGFPSGFDYLRFALAISVVVWHSVYISYGLDADVALRTSWPRPLIYAILPAFFGMGGFLVTASLQRNSIPAFMALRLSRIFPALCCDVVFAAFILGPLVTSVSLADYFSDHLFWTYLLNLVGYIHFHLPGVFLTNPSGSNVNAQLWTMPFEFISYGAIAALAVIGAIRRPTLLLGLVGAFTAYAVYKDITQLSFSDGPPGRYLVLACLWGTVLYVWRDRIPHSFALLAVAVAATLATMSFASTLCLSALPVVYIAVWLGTQNAPKVFPVNGTDYSYGLYVYGYPIQQTIALLLPDYRVWYVTAGLGVLFAFMAAYLSWHFVERPVLRRKDRIVAAVDTASDRIRGWLTSVRLSALLAHYKQLAQMALRRLNVFPQSRAVTTQEAGVAPERPT